VEWKIGKTMALENILNSKETLPDEGLAKKIFSGIRSSIFTIGSTLLTYATIGFTGIGYGSMIAVARWIRNAKKGVSTKFREFLSYYNIGNLLGFLDYGALSYINTLPGNNLLQKIWKGVLFNPVYTWIYNPIYLGIRHLKDRYSTVANAVKNIFSDTKEVLHNMAGDVKKNLWRFNVESFIYSGIPNWIAVNVSDNIAVQNTLGGIADVGYAAVASKY